MADRITIKELLGDACYKTWPVGARMAIEMLEEIIKDQQREIIVLRSQAKAYPAGQPCSPASSSDTPR